MVKIGLAEATSVIHLVNMFARATVKLTVASDMKASKSPPNIRDSGHGAEAKR